MSTSNHIPDAEGLEVVVIGSFNPAIFHPEWFLGQKFIAEEEAKSSEEQLNVVGREVTDIQLCGMKLLCLHDRLSNRYTRLYLSQRPCGDGGNGIFHGKVSGKMGIHAAKFDR